MCTIENLPIEILVKIFEYHNPNSLPLVSKRFASAYELVLKEIWNKSKTFWNNQGALSLVQRAEAIEHSFPDSGVFYQKCFRLLAEKIIREMREAGVPCFSSSCTVNPDIHPLHGSDIFSFKGKLTLEEVQKNFIDVDLMCKTHKDKNLEILLRCKQSGPGFLSFHLHEEMFAIPNEIAKVPSCDQIHFQNGKINYVPPEIGDLNGLYFLNLSENNLEYLPETISNLVNLTTLRLNKNPLKTLPQTIGKNFFNNSHFALYLDKDQFIQLHEHIKNSYLNHLSKIKENEEVRFKFIGFELLEYKINLDNFIKNNILKYVISVLINTALLFLSFYNFLTCNIASFYFFIVKKIKYIFCFKENNFCNYHSVKEMNKCKFYSEEKINSLTVNTLNAINNLDPNLINYIEVSFRNYEFNRKRFKIT